MIKNIPLRFDESKLIELFNEEGITKDSENGYDFIRVPPLDRVRIYTNEN